jgi:hypothetical protein
MIPRRRRAWDDVNARPVNARHSAAAFYALWLFIIVVSVLDGFLALRHQHLLMALELNPIGRWLLAINGGQVWYLLAAKFVGTVLACAALLIIRDRSPRISFVITAAVAAAQLCLLLFLTLG